MSKYYVVDERALMSCGLNITSNEEWTRLSWRTVWTTWIALAIICVYSLLKTVLTIWGRPAIKATNNESQEASPSISPRTGSAASTPGLVTDEDLAQVLAILSQDDTGADGWWEEVINKQSASVAYSAKRRDPKDGGATEYLSTTVFESCSTQLVRDYYMDSEFRAGWDKTLVQHGQLEVCPASGTEVGRMVKKFPLMGAREYVLAWRLWEGDDQTYYCVLKACEHDGAPRQSKYKRVEVYNSGWRIQKVPGREACEVKMIHQEDAGVQREMAKVAFRRGIWSYVMKMDTQLRRYALKHAELEIDPVSAVALAHKVPEALKATYHGSMMTRPAQASTTTESMDREGHDNNNRQLARRASQKKLAKGLLLAGGAVFLSQGSVSLGVKIATTCIVNRAFRGSQSSNNSVLRKRSADRSQVHRSDSF